MSPSRFQLAALATIAASVLFFGPLLLAGQPGRAGPSPEMRALVDELGQALNGSADAWEAFAQRRFSPALLKQRSAEDRRRMHERLRADFGDVRIGGAKRGGPGAPIELQITGASGPSGVIGLEVDESSSPTRITSLSVSVEMGNRGGRETADPGPLPAVNGRMTDAELTRALDEYFGALAAADAFSGVALVARDDVPVYQRAFGMADRANRVPNTVGTRFNIGSINKVFTQVAVHQLARDGKLAYTDTLGKFFPDHPQPESRSATIEQLLEHTAGLADIFGPEFSRASKDQFRSNADYFRFVSGLPARFAPGARSEYCNGCYIALGAIIEKVSGMPYERYVAEHVFTPAGMGSTGYPQVDANEPSVAIGYTRRGDGSALRDNVLLHGASGSAAGGGYSTAADLLAYVRAVRAGRFPGAEAEMGIGGGAPGINAVVEASRPWTVIVLANLDPPAAERAGTSVMQALRR